MRELDRRVHAYEQLTPAESYAWRKWAGHLPSEPRRKKKRKKKKLPRAPRPRCGRPCALQRQVPAAQGVLPIGSSDPVHLQSVGHYCCGAETSTHSAKLCRRLEIRQVQFLVDVDTPVVAQRHGYGQTVQKTVLVPQVQSIEGRRPPFVPHRQIPMVLPVQKTRETPQLQSARWSMFLLCRLTPRCSASLISCVSV